MKTRNQFGFTLIEILIAAILIAILAAILTPAYRNYILKGNRSDAIRSLQNTQILEEKYRVNNTTYGTLANLGMSTSAGNSIGGLYTITIPTNTTSSYTLSAAAIGTQASDTACTNFTITYANGTTTLSSAPQTDCWSQ